MKAAFFEVKEFESSYLKQQLPEVDCVFSGDLLDKATVRYLEDVDVISPFIRSQVSAEALDALPNVRLVATRSTGHDHIDLDACATRGIVVSNVPSYGENTVAEHTFALILALSRKIPQTHARVARGNYSLEGLAGFDIKGKTLGVVGAGRIGLHVIRIARGFGMQVLAQDVHRNPFLAELMGFEYAEIDELLRKSDVVTLHMPYSPGVHHFMNSSRFALMKPGALFINTARGSLVDTNALFAALKSGQLAGAGLDVIEGEELIQEERQLLEEQHTIQRLQQVIRSQVLLRRENVIFTLHNAFNSKEALQRILDTTAGNILSFAKGEPTNIVASQKLPRAA